jgi:Helix-turn-helix domain
MLPPVVAAVCFLIQFFTPSRKIPKYRYVVGLYAIYARYGKWWRASQGEAMVAARRIIGLSIDPDQRRALVDISRSRTEATGRVERARIIIAYLDTPSAYVVARQIEVSQHTVTRCLQRAAEFGVLAALDDRPRAGRDAVITREARAWLVSLACAKPIASGVSARAVDDPPVGRACA